MRLRNGQQGYGAVTKVLHWLSVFGFAAQFFVGYTMEAHVDARQVQCDPAEEGLSGGETSDATEERLDRREDRCENAQDRHAEAAEDAVDTAWSDLTGEATLGDGLSRPEIHVLLGLVLIALAVLRVLWRSTTSLPPWDERLTPADRFVVHITERLLLTLQFVVPITGIVLVAVNDDLLWLHILGQLVFFVALAAHLGLVLGKRLLPRMLPGGHRRTAEAGA